MIILEKHSIDWFVSLSTEGPSLSGEQCVDASWFRCCYWRKSRSSFLHISVQFCHLHFLQKKKKKALCNFLFNGLRWPNGLFPISRWGQRGHLVQWCVGEEILQHRAACWHLHEPKREASFLGESECFLLNSTQRHSPSGSCFLQTRFFKLSFKLVVALLVMALSHLFLCKKSLITK